MEWRVPHATRVREAPIGLQLHSGTGPQDC